MEKVKKISKYVMNFLAMINALLVGLAPIWEWNINKVTDTMVVVCGVLGLWLVGGKLFETKEEIEIYGDDDANN